MSLSHIISRNSGVGARNVAVLGRSWSNILPRGLSQLQPKKEEEFDPDKPVVFSTSPAAKNPKFAFVTPTSTGPADDMPWYHPHASILSLAIFMIYFLALREENDIDLAIGGQNTTDYAKELLALQKKAQFDEKQRALKNQ